MVTILIGGTDRFEDFVDKGSSGVSV